MEVARFLLDKGLTWCDGVVFLDDNDEKRVLVRASGRAVSADQCGVPLERRFAFYDQIHTTGMDIKHIVNAVAVITLGKDMVFRDYVQGAFRMRGIGAGQRIHLYVSPEVADLLRRELIAAGAHALQAMREQLCGNPEQNGSKQNRIVDAHADETVTAASGGDKDAVLSVARDTMLQDVVAWLVVNSMRSEQTQWSMLCLQNVANIYRYVGWSVCPRGCVCVVCAHAFPCMYVSVYVMHDCE
jgi:hypothetical protein